MKLLYVKKATVSKLFFGCLLADYISFKIKKPLHF